ncbi:nickel ABC transporter permease subunit NikB [Deltaproteobacteria bacterium Smac51]|nr:nickel ABC transporter permease subunit NikB [Deltaproteobacteria bacterium Smac51]
MTGYIFRRVLQLIPILFGVTLINFGLMYISPGDAAERTLIADGARVSAEVLEARRAELGLNRPFAVQYFHWLKNLARGDLGESYATGRPVWAVLSESLPNTVLLAGSAMLLTILISIPLGLLAAVRQNTAVDNILRAGSFMGLSMPSFVLALVLIYVFGLKLKLLPVVGGTGLKGLILPSVTLAAALTSGFVRQVRAAVLEELGRGYVLGARARGVKERYILYFNVLKNALLPIVTLIGISFGRLLGGTAVVEIIFMWPGLGRMAVEAISQRDYPVVQGYVMWMAAIFVAVNLVADISYRLLNPRVRYADEAA